MVLLSNYYRGLVCRCNACGALLGYGPEDVFDNSYVKCPVCNFKILTKMQLDYDGSKNIDQFINDCNKKYPNRKPFKSYYTRSWVENGRTILDVGSWSEFFVWDKDEFQ